MEKEQFKAWKREMDEEEGSKAKITQLCIDMDCLKKDIEQLKKLEPCPSCERTIPSDSLVCPYCKAEFDNNKEE